MSTVIPSFLLPLVIASVPPVYGELIENIEYGQGGGSSLRLDARIPEGRGRFAAAIIVHGGAWVTGDRRHSVAPLFQPLMNARIATFSISYRLAKRGPEGFSLPNNIAQMLNIGTQIDDVRQAVTYVKAHAEEYHVDPERIALIGESAGAQLASMAALRPNEGGRVRAVVAFYGPNDLVKLVESSTWIPDALRQVLAGSPFEKLLFAGLRDLSPISWVTHDSPPFLLIHGTADTLVPFEQSQELCDKLHSAGIRCEVYPVEGGHHGIRWWEADGLTDYKEHMVKWLRRELH